MELAKKAYKVAFPEYLTDSEKLFMWEDNRFYTVAYGKNMRNAINEFCKENEDSLTYWELKQKIKAKRFKEGDVFSQKRHELLDDLSLEQINVMLHSLGVNYRDICPMSFHRNYFFTYDKDDICESLVLKDLMTLSARDMGNYYHVTPKAIEAIKTLLLVRK